MDLDSNDRFSFGAYALSLNRFKYSTNWDSLRIGEDVFGDIADVRGYDSKRGFGDVRIEFLGKDAHLYGGVAFMGIQGVVGEGEDLGLLVFAPYEHKRGCFNLINPEFRKLDLDEGIIKSICEFRE